MPMSRSNNNKINKTNKNNIKINTLLNIRNNSSIIIMKLIPSVARAFHRQVLSIPNRPAASTIRPLNLQCHLVASTSTPLFSIQLKPLIRTMSTSRVQFSSDFFLRQVSECTRRIREEKRVGRRG